MGVYIKGMAMPKSCEDCPLENCDENYYGDESNHRCPLIYKGYTSNNRYEKRRDDCPLVRVPPHGRLIDADALRQSMYHEAFETDSPMQKWDSGCWIRYKMFERLEENAPTIIPADKDGET